MQTVCDQKIFDVFHANESAHSKDTYRPNVMSAAETRLEWQVFLGGLAVSGIMLLVIKAFGLF
ncbi:hypothetical protein LJC26_03505 [Desulfovibrio sp. OttesenSCG-928-O18]|nr:hypothetical protein [Desulfovibrio sp. OttesenSCG-928-O18]